MDGIRFIYEDDRKNLKNVRQGDKTLGVVIYHDRIEGIVTSGEPLVSSQTNVQTTARDFPTLVGYIGRHKAHKDSNGDTVSRWMDDGEMQEGMTFNQIAAQEKSGELDELDPNHLHEMRWYDAGLELQAMPESVIAKLKEIVKEKSVNLPSK